MKTGGLIASLSLTLSVMIGCSNQSFPVSASNSSSLQIASVDLGQAVTGVTYNGNLSASGGSGNYSWSVDSGVLPAGLALDSSSGTISGTSASAGQFAFTVLVRDSASPTQAVSKAVSLVVVPRMAAVFTSPVEVIVGKAYNSAVVVTGGTLPYTTSVTSGGLPNGLSLSGETISGTPLIAGSWTFSVTVRDSGQTTQSLVLPMQFQVVNATTALTVTSASFFNGTAGTAYTSVSLSAKGGTLPYSWSVNSGSLPPGLTLSGQGVVSGTPTTAGTYNFQLQVQDAGSPAQVEQIAASITIAPSSGTGKTWYVRTDGGTRYSTRMLQGQCDGMSDVAYPGSGVNQHCAFGDVRFLWQDGSYTVSNAQSAFPAYGWVGAGGDTYLIHGSLANGVTWRVGYGNASSTWDQAAGHDWGVAGDPFSSGAPPPLSGTATQHTRILGENYLSCHAASAKTQLHGGYGVGAVLDMAGASYVDVSCLDITDFDSCGRSAQTNTCNSNIGSLSDYATNGITWTRTSTNDTLTDVHIHGMASAGMLGATGDGVVMDYVDVIGNASSGWNSDRGDGTTGTGSLLVQHYNISWNGCAEEYPIVDAQPYKDCTDDNSGGYGDGFGTASVASNPGWHVSFDQGTVAYNTQDGLDALHLYGNGSSVKITRTLAYGNMGQQIKIGGAGGVAINNIITTNCNAMRDAIPGTPAGYNSRLSDYCRAADAGVVVMVSPNTQLVFDYNTIYSASATAIEIDCDLSNGACDKTASLDFRNNAFLGFTNNQTDGYPAGGSNDYSNPIYNGAGTNFIANPGSLYSNNIFYHPKSNWTCPSAPTSVMMCVNPLLVDEGWHNYGAASSVAPTSSSPAIGAGAAIAAISIDYYGNARKSNPTIGALEQ